MAKLRVNGVVVKETIPLKDFDTIELGSYKFQSHPLPKARWFSSFELPS